MARKDGKFQTGESGNPSGRPKNPFGPLVRERTKEGLELVERVLKVLRGKNDKLAMHAAEWLRDTGWCKPAQSIDFGAGDGNITVKIIQQGSGKKWVK